MVLRIFNPNIEEGGSLNLRSACSSKWVLEQPGLHRNPVSKIKKKITSVDQVERIEDKVEESF